MKFNFENIDQYITDQSVDVQPILDKIRIVIKKTAPEATEIISYGMPAYKYYGILV